MQRFTGQIDHAGRAPQSPGSPSNVTAKQQAQSKLISDAPQLGAGAASDADPLLAPNSATRKLNNLHPVKLGFLYRNGHKEFPGTVRSCMLENS